MASASASSPSGASPEAAARKTVYRWTALVVLTFALAISLPFAGKKMYRRVHAYRAEQLAAKATALLNDERWEAAMQVLQKEYRTYGKDAPVQRALATLFLDGYDDPMMGSSMLRQVLASGHGTNEDTIKLAKAVLKLGDTPEAKRLYDLLPEAMQGQRQGLELLAGIYGQSGRKALAEETLRKALTSDPDDPRSQFRLALLDEASSFEVSKTVASQSVWNIARRNDNLALEAITHLCTSQSLSASQAQELLTLVDQNPKAVPRDRYRALTAYLRVRPLEREKVIAAEVERNRGMASEKLFEFLRWLGAQKQYATIISLVKVSTALQDPDLFLVYVDALSAAERWKELLDLVEEPKVPTSDSTRHFISAECKAHLRPSLTETAQHIEKVYSFAGPADQQVVVKAAALADSKGMNNLAIIGFQKVAESRPNLRVGLLEKVLELQQREKSVPGMVGTLKRLNELRPNNHNYIDLLTYLRLVTGDEIELACDQVAIGEKSTASTVESSAVPQRLLRALAALRMGDTARMAEEIKAVDTSVRLAPGQRAVMAGMVATHGDDVAAFRLAETVPSVLLLPDEAVFLRRALK